MLIRRIPVADVPEALALGAALAALAALLTADELSEGVPVVPPKGTLWDEMLAIPSVDKATDTPLPFTQTEFVSGAPVVKLTPAHSINLEQRAMYLIQNRIGRLSNDLNNPDLSTPIRGNRQRGYTKFPETSHHEIPIREINPFLRPDKLRADNKRHLRMMRINRNRSPRKGESSEIRCRRVKSPARRIRFLVFVEARRGGEIQRIMPPNAPQKCRRRDDGNILHLDEIILEVADWDLKC
jgi:hypothetical protein